MVSKVLLVYLTCSSRKLPKQQRKHLHASQGKSDTGKTYVKTLRGSLKDTLADGEDTELEEFTGKKRWWGHANHIPGRIQCEFNKTWAGLERKTGKSTQRGRQWLSTGLNRGEKEEVNQLRLQPTCNQLRLHVSKRIRMRTRRQAIASRKSKWRVSHI